RRHVREARGRTSSLRSGDVEALLVDGGGHQLCTGGGERRARAEIAGLLDPHGVAGIEEHPRRQIEGGLRTADDDDLLVLAEDAAGGAEGGGDGLTKRREPGRERVAHGVRAGVAGASREEACPERERKLGESRNAGLEGDRTGVFGSPDGRERA